MADLSDMTLDKFKLWSTNALRVFLSMRKKSIKGNFDEIAARAFCTWEENISVDTTAEQQQRRLLDEYKAKLVINNDKIQDPFSVTDGWMSEKSGLTKWPSVYITDISEYLNGKNPQDLMKRLLNEYKEGKAYRYFTGDWVKEIFYHENSADSNMCFVKSKVTPSQAVNNKPYDVWIILLKDSGNIPGGQVLGAYCSCTAGMMGSCNHIAGVLFRIEHAVKTGMTRPSCTSKVCEWTVPKKKTKIKPGKVTDFLWKKSNYSKLQVDVDKENAKFAKKKSFTPLRKKQLEKVNNSDGMRREMYDALKDEIPDSCFSLLMEKRRLIVEPEVKVNSIPPCLGEVAKEIKKTNLSTSEKEELLMTRLQLDGTQIHCLERATASQNESECWKEQRRGRVTASNFHRVSRRSQSLKENSDEDPTSVVKLVMGTERFIQTKAMKHGVSSEPIAKRAYVSLTKSTHKRFRTQNCGMFCHQSKPYIAASPDLLVCCDCCGEGLCEIKCPESIKDQKPTTENVPYLTIKDGAVSLKKNHPYYFQIQGQMGITGRKYCDFFVFTFHGSICTRIYFDSELFEEIVEKVSWFWNAYIKSELLKQDVLSEKKFN